MTENQFKLLKALKLGEIGSQRDLAQQVGIAVSSVNDNLKKLAKDGLVEKLTLTAKGEAKLSEYKTDNAIIMAAGMSSRFAPVSYELPKGLVKVKGEILIERQIRQLKEAGIDDITVVIGYMKEKFFYLEEKFGVRLVVNPDYYRFNNTSTLYLVKEHLGNTYICSSDNYFVENVFEQYVYGGYYACVYQEGVTDEYCVKADKDGYIDEVSIGGSDSLIMMGHVYFDRQFSKKFAAILEKNYYKAAVKEMLWEKLYAENLPKLQLRVREYAAREVLEFDSVDDLLHFDTDFLENVDSEAVNNIVAVLKCSPSDIKEIFILKKGLTNNSFRFRVGEKRYVYRHPGAGTEAIISRRSEKFSEEQAFRLGLDETYIYMDEVKGWKIAHYVENNRDFDYHNGEDVQKIIKLIRKLHDAGISSLYEYDMFAESEKILSLLKEGDKKDFTDFEKLRAKIKKLYELAEQDNVKKCLCHVDCYAPNFLTDGVKMQLIDWEYSGFSDPAGDIGTMICCSDYDEQEAEDLLRLYFGGAMSDVEERHWKAYIAIAAYYWFVWALYKESIGNHVGEYLLLWYRYAKKYVDIAGKLYGV